jgi:hypothetical protein
MEYRKITKHHILPKSRKGTNEKMNIMRLYSDKHVAWHEMFGLFTIYEILQTNILMTLYPDSRNYKVVFGDKNHWHAERVLKRYLQKKRAWAKQIKTSKTKKHEKFKKQTNKNPVSRR